MPRIVIDRELCLRSGQCAYLQPELFEMDLEGDGDPIVLVGDIGDPKLIAKAEDAITMCPGQAIRLQNGR